MQDTYVDFDRVCNLKKGDRFLISGVWKIVFKVTKESVHSRHSTGRGAETILGSKSQQIVQVVKKENVERC